MARHTAPLPLDENYFKEEVHPCLVLYMCLFLHTVYYAYICMHSLQFSAFYIGGFVVIVFGLILYNILSVPEGGTEQSVFSIGYWYNYGHSLLFEWKCCPPSKIDDKLMKL